MNKKNINKILFSNAPLKAIALILGYSVWHILATGQTISVWIDVPLSFYSLSTDLTIDAPETIAINVVGKRTDLYNLEKEQLAIHINAAELLPGPQQFFITSETLFLPETIKLVHYKPSNLIINVTEKVTTNTAAH